MNEIKKKEKLLLIRRENGVENDAMRLLLFCCRLECSSYGIFIVFTVVIVVLEDIVKRVFLMCLINVITCYY